MDFARQLQLLEQRVMRYVDNRLFPFIQNGRLNLVSGLVIGSLPSGSVAATNYVFSEQSSVTIVHNKGAYPLVQVFDNSGRALASAIVTHVSTNSFKVDFIDSTVEGWGTCQWGSSKWGGGLGGVKWGHSPWGTAGWGSRNGPTVRASGFIVYL